MLLEEASAHVVKSGIEELLRQYLPSHFMVGFGHLLQLLTLLDHIEEDLHEVLQRELIQEVDRRQAVKREEDAGRHVSQGLVLFGHLLDLMHGFISLLDLLSDLLGLLLESLECLDELVVLKDVTFGFSELVEELVLKLSEFDTELTLELNDVVSLLVDFRALFLEEDVQALVLQTRRSHGEVDKGNSRAEIGCKHSVGVTSDHVQSELVRVVDFLISNSDEDTSTSFLNLLVEDAVEDGVNLLDVLDHKR
mmetsp:Transcript_20729/g.31813  ORF Transcript_20729/g.31813 Transcript_20729/m.31813 type:complete len:251 (-) Transcript_20729:10750-11502(-)